jgi:ribosome biogenesis GTPase
MDEDEIVDRKEWKRHRKVRSLTDRSRFKKSDIDQKKKTSPTISPDWVRGRVLAIEPEGVIVQEGDRILRCSIRGTLKQERTREKGLLAVGDWVWFEPADGDSGAIALVEERTSWLARADSFGGQLQQLIAANVDQVLVTVSVVEPPLKPALIDRYLIAAKKGKMAACLVVNKIDLLKTAEDPLWSLVEPLYRSLGVPVIPVSAQTGEGMELLRSHMQGRTSVFAGQSGVGKTALINHITGLSLPVGQLMRRAPKGSHTTKKAQLIPLIDGGWCVDTPGVRSFGVWDLSPQEVSDYFDEIRRLGSQCRYPSCRHVDEPDCAVRAAAERGEIHPLRYNSYLTLLEDAQERRRHAH